MGVLEKAQMLTDFVFLAIIFLPILIIIGFMVKSVLKKNQDE